MADGAAWGGTLSGRSNPPRLDDTKGDFVHGGREPRQPKPPWQEPKKAGGSTETPQSTSQSDNGKSPVDAPKGGSGSSEHQTQFTPPKEQTAPSKEETSPPRDSAQPSKDTGAHGDSAEKSGFENTSGADVIRKAFDHADEILARGGDTPKVHVSKGEDGYVVIRFKDGPLKGTVAHYDPKGKQIMVEPADGKKLEFIDRKPPNPVVRVDKNNTVMASTDTLL
jgi:hypothetical protein